jgi:2-polyprenyl-3-methyl-5-hydroxy-6-metoxy-1,4-benzoquinol methylase
VNETIQRLLKQPPRSSSALHQRSKSYWAQCVRATAAASTCYDRQAQVPETEVLPKIGPLVHALDIGCADGRFPRILGRHARHALGIDISAPLIAPAQNSAGNASYVRFHVQDAEAQLPSVPFDLISFMGVLSTLVDDDVFEKLLRDIAKRVSNQGWPMSKDTVSRVEEQRRVERKYTLIYRNWSHYRQAIERAGFELDYRSDLASWTTTQVNVLAAQGEAGLIASRQPQGHIHVRRH